ncbi:MAG: flagellar biosynthesis protein FlhB [Peptostreptococcaceae bacterium]|nr:flagellar biosynthesis protein FlhB [Peptostreptococcaceae bacterium]
MAADSKTEKATPKKRRDERKKGHVLMSRDVVIASSLIGVFSALKLLFPFVNQSIGSFMSKYLMLMSTTTKVDAGTAQNITQDFIITFAKTAFPILLASSGIAIIATMAQTKLLFTTDAIKFKWEKLNPIQGIQRMFALKNLVELTKNLIKITIMAVVLYQFIVKRLVPITRTMDMALGASIGYMLNTVMSLVYTIAIIFVVISAGDYLYQWWDYERQIKMSKQEVKEEYKQTEGDPQIKGKIKDMQRKMAMSRMMQAVPEADVVIKNPTHFAVALKYDIDKDPAPIVLAKGQDELALRIIKVAEESGVKVLENRPLARSLFAQTEIGYPIPSEHYGEIAEILVKILDLSNR